MVNNLFNGMFGKIESGLCRLSMSGGIAIKTANGYKSYNVKTGRLTNCDSFVFNIGEEFFFVIPTNKVSHGDIILVQGKPRCVISVTGKNRITVVNYEDSTMETIIPERHVFMGNTYFYGKIVSMFGNGFGNGKNKMQSIMSYMMMSEMMKGNSSTLGNNNSMMSGMSAMLPFMIMNNGGSGNMFENMFDGMFDGVGDDTIDIGADEDAVDDSAESED